MTFHFPYFLSALLIPVLLWIYDFRRRRSIARELAHPKILRANAGVHHLELAAETSRNGNSDTTSVRVRWRLWLGLAFAIVAFARPQWGKIDEPVFDQAREILIALDLSRSMLTPDIKPSRLDRGKLLVTSLLEQLKGERVGLMVFAGTAFLQSPLSSDYEILNEFLPALTPDFLPEGGTNYKALIDTALSAFGASSSADRFLIVLSDGEATDDNWKSAAAELKARGVRVIALGVGTAEGAIVPDGAGGYVKDERGAVVLSKLEPATLQQLAEMTNGTYRDASAWVDLAQLVEATVDTGKKGAFREERQVRLVERFQWALAPALLLFFLSFWREFPVHPRSRDLKLGPASRQTPPPLPPKTQQGVAKNAAKSAAAALLCALMLGGASKSNAAVSNTSAAEPLSALVGQLAARPNLNARDYAELAKSTITYGERMKTAKEPIVEGTIQDGIAATEAGQALDPKAADWKALQTQLRELLEKPSPPPPPPKSDKKDEKDQNQDQKDQKDQQKSQDQNSGENKSDKSKSNDKQDQQGESKNQQQKPDDQKNDTSGQPSEKDKSNQDQQSEPQPQKQDKAKQESAFGDMKKQNEPPPAPAPQNGANPETQRVGGTPDKPTPDTPTNPELAVPLQKLEQVRNQDSPVRLQQMMRGDKQTPAKAGKNW